MTSDSLLFVVSLWMGLEDSSVESMFRWTDGYLATWVNWYNNAPVGRSNHGEGEYDCVYRRSDGKWQDDGDCDNAKGFYCETVQRKFIKIVG